MQRWSRGHKARGQGLKQKSEAKAEDRPSRGQGHRRKCSQKNFLFRRSQKKSSKKFLLVLELRSRGFYVHLAVLVTGADMLWIRGMAQKAINIAANWASEQELQFSSKKNKIVQFTHKRNPGLGFLSMNGSKLQLSMGERLLGVNLDSKLTRKPHITCKATTALMQCRQIVGKT